MLILITIAISTSQLGVYLVLRGQSMLADAIAHAVLLGIVLTLFIVSDLGSPLLIVGAAIFGAITVLAIEALSRSPHIRRDDAIGTVFPVFFALAIILINTFFKRAHIDTEAILMGEILFAGLNTVDILGIAIPRSLLSSGVIMLVNLAVMSFCYTPMKYAFFDEAYAKLKGLPVTALSLLFIVLTSVTTVASFEAVGSILVLALFITPSATAFLFTKSLKRMFLLSAAISCTSVVLATLLAFQLNVSIAGMIAALELIIYLLALLLHADGLLASMRKRRRLLECIRRESFLLHVAHHDGTADEKTENSTREIHKHLNWAIIDVERTAKRLIEDRHIAVQAQTYRLTAEGQAEVERIREQYLMR